MEKIYSKVNPNTLLHIVVRKEDLIAGRTDVVPGEHFIQCAILNMENGKTFQPHNVTYRWSNFVYHHWG